ncbi:paired amphipathic helix protein Sin3-like 2 isoform X3 [Capsicum annuum]|uniref:paired amphipathic helix protein Sin3-like 2 isoform X3 n=1 Tax=Capsicum annuum TaxID=4072 RepID=UPI0007BF87AB|nr:paired amphipathic helix protein Sin3-like 2 isoform X3 [Capsicum annuum]
MARLRPDVSGNVRFKRPTTSSIGESYGQSQAPGSGLGGGGGGGSSAGGAGANNPKLTAVDALSYLKEVKGTFQSQKYKYNIFLDVLRDFKAKRIDTVGVMARVKFLFKGHPRLILGFNTFLPNGYEITLRDEDESPKKTTEFEEAISFVNKIKARFQSDVHVYKSFLDLLNMYRKERKGINEVYHEVAVLFNDHPDLLDEFSRFLPRTSGTAENRDRRTHDEDYKEPDNENKGDQSKQRQTDKMKYLPEVEDVLKYSCGKGFTFCEKVKERVGSPTDYQEFLKCFHIYSTGVISGNELQSLVAHTLGKYPDLMEGFNKFIERYDRAVGHLVSVMTKLNDGHTNPKLVKEEKKDQEQTCRTEVAPQKVTFEEAVRYVGKVKERFRNNDHVYISFLDILKMYREEHKNNYEVYHEVAVLFNDHPDLLDEFTNFLPDSSTNFKLWKSIDELTILFGSL